jgi:hypothetical protein
MLQTWIEEHARWKKRDLSSGATFTPWMALMCGAVSGSRAMHPGSEQRNAGKQVGAARLHRELLFQIKELPIQQRLADGNATAAFDP